MGTATDVEETPDITVELGYRRSTALPATLAGAIAGVCFLPVVELAGGATSGIGILHVFESPTLWLYWLFHAVLATVFGTTFGMLVDSRPFWQYGRGFLGPFVGVAFGLLLWAVSDVVFWPAFMTALSIPLAPSPPVFQGIALSSYLAYGFLVGSILNFIGLVRA